MQNQCTFSYIPGFCFFKGTLFIIYFNNIDEYNLLSLDKRHLLHAILLCGMICLTIFAKRTGFGMLF